MVVLPIHSVVYLWTFVITIYGSPTNPFSSIFEEFVITKYGSPTNLLGSMFEECCHKNMVVLPIHSVVYLWTFVITIYGSPTNPFSSIFEEFCHYKIW